MTIQLSILERSFKPIALHTMPFRDERVMTAAYLLVRGQEVVYVGATENLQYRISSHNTEMRRLKKGAIKDGKRFDRTLFMPVPRRYLRLFEQALIREITPEYNKRLDGPIRGETAVLFWLGLRDSLSEDDIAQVKVVQ